MDRKEHWERLYQTNAPDAVSWFQAEARLSHALIRRLEPNLDAPIIDVGAGASVLIDHLLADGYRHLTVVDISSAALTIARSRLGAIGATVEWLAADLLTAPLPEAAYQVWHDRAVFHFLTEPDDRARYVGQVRRAMRPGGLVLVATFAEDGPTRCSGLEVERYSPGALHREFGAGFELLESHREQHRTPAGATQSFSYCVCRYRPAGRILAA